MKNHFTILVFLMLISMINFAQKEQVQNNSFSGNLLEKKHSIKSFFMKMIPHIQSIINY